uniref:Uncharacterized protein n=1 Tax=Rhizophagus irregularis (strain DAOM 181602 / DAOM 197198 / MUCL 43194) TaxID=747089 RepID=U9UIX3_RHIID
MVTQWPILYTSRRYSYSLFVELVLVSVRLSFSCPLMEVLLDRRVPYSTTEDLDISLDANRPIVALYFL